MRLSRVHALAIGAFFAFSLMPLFTRGANAGVMAIAAWRSVLVALIFGGWAYVAEGGIKPDRQTVKLGTIYGLALALASSTFVGGYAFTTVANTIFLHNLAPAAAFPLAWWAFRERPGAPALTGAALAVAGVAMLSGVSLFHFAHFTNPRFLLGDSLAMLSAVGYAAVLVATRATRQANDGEGTPILGTLFVAWSVSAVVLVLVALFTGGMSVSGRSLLWILGLAVVCTNLPFYLLNLSMKKIGAGLASVLSMSEVVFATGLGLAVYGENLSPLGWMGGGLVALGVLYPLTQSEDAPDADAPAALSAAALAARLPRLGVGLALFNGGAVLALMTGSGAGALLAWAGLAALLRLGVGGAAAALEGRYRGGLRIGAGLLAAMLLGGLALRGGWEAPGSSWAAAAVALGALALETLLAAREPADERDGAPLFAASLALIGAGQLLSMLGHPAGDWLAALAAFALGLMTWGVLLGALRGQLPDTPAHLVAGVAPLDGLALRARRPRLAIPAALALLAAGGVRVVPVGHQAVVERLGAPLAEPAEPGLLLRLPPPVDRVTLVDVAGTREVTVITGDTPLLCGDQSMVSLTATAHWRVSDPHAYVFSSLVPEDSLARLTRAALVESVSQSSQDEVLTTGRRALEEDVRQRAQRAVDQVELGVLLEAVHVSEVTVPAPVLAAFLDVISATEEKRTAINLAEAYAADLLPKARGEAGALMEVAMAEAEVSMAIAEGEAALFQALLEGGAAGQRGLRYELGRQAADAALGRAALVLAPRDVRIWMGGARPVDPTPLKESPR